MALALQIAGLTRRYRGKTGIMALDAVSIDVEQGSLLAVIGAAGSGKSTLLRILAGLERATDGRFAHTGVDAGRIGTMLQSDVLSIRHTLAENVAAPLRRVRPVPQRGVAARLTAHALELFQLTPLARTFPQNTDAAIRQRALLARAFVAEPRLLLLDEPFSMQDENGRAALVHTVRQLHELLGTTTILATRSAAVALPLADRMAVLQYGRLTEAGSPQALYDSPGSARTASLLGPVNRLAGTVMLVEEDIAAVRLACGPVVEARAPEALRPGSPCMVCIRPERIAVVAASAAELGDNALDATLIATRFAGATVRLHLLIGSGAEVIIDRPTGASLRGLAAGQPAAIAWQPHHAHAYAADSAD